MTLRTTQNKNVVGSGAAGGGFSIRGSQAHSNLMAKKWGNEERAKITLPKLKFLETDCRRSSCTYALEGTNRCYEET
jgi:hypothetical protein